MINKADTDNLQKAGEARAAYERAMQLYPPKENGWIPKVLSCSSLEQQGIDAVWELIRDYIRRYRANGYLSSKRQEQNQYWFKQSMESQLKRHFYASRTAQEQLGPLMEKVARNELSPFRAAALLLKGYERELK